MKTIDYDLTAGEPLRVNQQGNYFHILEASYSLDVELMKNEAVTEHAKGVESGFYTSPEGGFTALRLTSATSQRIKIGISSGKGGYTRSIVQTVDGGKSTTQAGEAFLGSVGSAPAVGVYSHAQLFNPAGSGKNLVVAGVSFSSPSATTIEMGVSGTQLADFAAFGKSKLGGGAASVGERRREQNAAQLVGADYFLSYSVSAGSVQTINFKEPVVLPPGYGLMLAPVVVNTQVIANFEYTESA